MTVAELIEKLRDLPQDMAVAVVAGNVDSDIQSVYKQFDRVIIDGDYE